MNKAYYLFFIFLFIIPCLSFAQSEDVRMRIVDTLGKPIDNANILYLSTKATYKSDVNGYFTVSASIFRKGEEMRVSKIGYKTKMFNLGNRSKVNVVLEQLSSSIDAVEVTTGYQQFSKRNATGSIDLIDKNILDRRVSPDIVSRLENMSNAVLFDRRTEGQTELSVRGRSTINSDANPLIILDNFPFEGDLSNINPNDIESVSILKDASASAIWGARAGNGVIVINTRKGRYGEKIAVEFNANSTIGEKSNLFLYRNYLDSKNYIDVERFLFDQGFYENREQDPTYPLLSPAVELLIAQRDGVITEGFLNEQLAVLNNNDLRTELSRHVYQPVVNQQYSVNLRGGGENYNFNASVGQDFGRAQIRGTGSGRTTLNLNSMFKLTPKLELSNTTSFIASSQRFDNEIVRSLFGGARTTYPYAKLADENGSALPVWRDYRRSFVIGAEQTGLQNWEFYPLDDLGNMSNRNSEQDIRINTALKYSIFPYLNIEGRYQYDSQLLSTDLLYGNQLYSTRDLINRYAQLSGNSYSFPIPLGDILDETGKKGIAHSFRLQLSGNHQWGKHTIDGVAGMEVRENQLKSVTGRTYGYDDDQLTFSRVDYENFFVVSPAGYSDRIPTTDFRSALTDRFLSYYGNFNYLYNNKYLASFSLRKDASNLFGVESNQRGVPLWSAGMGWLIDKEEDWLNNDIFSQLKLRASYGYSGNVNKSLTAFATGIYTTSSLTGLRHIQLQTPPNPNLRWEKVGTLNLGLDFGLWNNLVAGSVDYYVKDATDLIGQLPLNPTIGFSVGGRSAFIGNGSSLTTKGVDVNLAFQKSWNDLSVNLRTLYSYNLDEVTSYEFTDHISSFLGPYTPPLEGMPRSAVYSLPSAGLDPVTGDPRLLINNEIFTDYDNLWNVVTVDDLIYHGPALPKHFGSLIPTIVYKGWSVGFSVNYKLGHYFKLSSISYQELFENGLGNVDFNRRWREPGDEVSTIVPSMPQVGVSMMRDVAYQVSDDLVLKGDHIRLRDITLGYNIRPKMLEVKSLKIYAYVDNVALLWTANKQNVDPDYYSYPIPPVRTWSLGAKLNF
ncbi:SusC/RagA family TonB-linked outer membrane protein [Sphingobacterium deserti]|uniref:TonB-dependent receptor plug n=1 Tax=Sphingobacterium deserti TaxID=1229276 RepID=A0A0B8SYX8_9SPHI|nr:SusC/RagA family TonB-linked outer membrane protein [Sphingobacterium deserti]KGE12456.1 TonB-dependent receptor plug [Sphingobacterium deserti]